MFSFLHNVLTLLQVLCFRGLVELFKCSVGNMFEGESIFFLSGVFKDSVVVVTVPSGRNIPLKEEKQWLIKITNMYSFPYSS